MRVKNWDYRELRERIADGVTLPSIHRFYCDPVPKHERVQPRLQSADAADASKLSMIWWFKPRSRLAWEDGAKLRVDTTVVETDIHHPTDNTYCGTWYASSRA